MKRAFLLLAIVLLTTVTTACLFIKSSAHIHRVGLLVEDTIADQGWNSKGYEGLLKIQSSMGVDVFLKEEMKSASEIRRAVEEFSDQKVNLIFGHGRLFAEIFNLLNEEYPHIHFVSFNGEVEGDNQTSLHFNGYAMGYFAGMLAAKMTESNKVGVIAVEPWQPEIEGFSDGVSYINENIETFIELVGEWSNSELALSSFTKMKDEGVDVFYPCGDGFTISIIEAVKNHHLFSIGYVSDFSDIGGASVLTSTIQNVDKLYELVAHQFNEGTLNSGNVYYDFSNQIITMGPYSSVVPEEIKAEIDGAINHYIETGLLPHEVE